MTKQAVLEPKEADVDNDEAGNDGGDGDRPGWVIDIVGKADPVIVHLDGTSDEEIGEEEVDRRYTEALKKGGPFRLGTYKGPVDRINYIAWSDSVSLPELESKVATRDQLADTAEALQDLADVQHQIQQQHFALQEHLAISVGAIEAEQQQQQQPRPRQQQQTQQRRSGPRPLRYRGDGQAPGAPA